MSKPEIWQCIRLFAPTDDDKQWKSKDCVAAYCMKCNIQFPYYPPGNTKTIAVDMNKYHSKMLCDYVVKRSSYVLYPN